MGGLWSHRGTCFDMKNEEISAKKVVKFKNCTMHVMAIPWGHLESVKGCFGSVFGVSWGCFESDIGVIRGLESGIECPWVL